MPWSRTSQPIPIPRQVRHAPRGGDDVERIAPIENDASVRWLPAAQTRGEGILIRLREDRVAAWEGDTLHAAACHACLFAPETSCEQANRYLDRAAVVPILASPHAAYFQPSR